ncbi:MAG: phosphoglycolate phosphatase [Gammaproteobacteria bacterium]|nr:phosphoglycolate phosphatase [Gammaproteobacteria bacterium]
MTDVAVRLVLFDLDGTLVNSAPDIAHAANSTLGDLDLPPIAFARVRSFIGNGAERLIHRCLTNDLNGDAPAALHREAYAKFQAHYQQCLCDRSRPYPGVSETLGSLFERGLTLGCVTNKPARFTTPLLRDLELEHFFAITVAGDTLAHKKPAPEPLLYAIAYVGATAAATVMVGDSLTDLRAARAAGTHAYCVDYGYADPLELIAHGPDAVIGDFPELLRLLRG